MDREERSEVINAAVLHAYQRFCRELPFILGPQNKRLLCLWLSERAIPQDGQEDPGSVLTGASEELFAAAAAFKDIFRLVGCEDDRCEDVLDHPGEPGHRAEP